MADQPSSAAQRIADAIIDAMQDAERVVGLWTRRDIVAALMANPDLLADLAIEAGWVPPNVTTVDLSHVQEIAARLDDFDD